MRKTCYIDLISQKIKSLNAAVKTVEMILGLLKKDYIYLELEKKEAMALQDSLANCIKAV